MVVKSATKKRMMDLGVPEVLAHALADEMKMGDWKDLPLKGRNSGFKKQFFKRVKPVARKMNTEEWERNRLTQLNERRGKARYRPPREMLEHEKYIMTVAALNEQVVEMFYQMIHYLPLLNADTMFPEIPSQGLFNWVSFSGEKWEKDKRVRYEQALTVFDVEEYDIKRKQLVERAMRHDWDGDGLTNAKRYKNPYDYYEDKHPDWTKKYQPYYKDPKNYARYTYSDKAVWDEPEYRNLNKENLYSSSASSA